MFWIRWFFHEDDFYAKAARTFLERYDANVTFADAQHEMLAAPGSAQSANKDDVV